MPTQNIAQVERKLGEDQYLSISSPSQGMYKENGSKFLALAYPCNTAEKATTIVAELRKKYHDATHHCYAYRIGKEGEVYRINDDGEPSSTAGRQIYGEILSANLSDILIVVVRWFGGVKLGVPGLIRSYKSASGDAISNAEIVVKRSCTKIKIEFPYHLTNLVIKELKRAEADITERNFAQDCSICALVPKSQVEGIKKMLNLQPNGEIIAIEEEN